MGRTLEILQSVVLFMVQVVDARLDLRVLHPQTGQRLLLLEFFSPLCDHFVESLLDEEEQVPLLIVVAFLEEVLLAAHLHLPVDVRLLDHVVFELDVLSPDVNGVLQSASRQPTAVD